MIGGITAITGTRKPTIIERMKDDVGGKRGRVRRRYRFNITARIAYNPILIRVPAIIPGIVKRST